MSNHYRRYVSALSAYNPKTITDIIELDNVYRTARKAEKYGKTYLSIALLDVSHNLSDTLRITVIQAAKMVLA